jgi:hypothetical protein
MMDLERELLVKRVGIVVVVIILAAFPVYVLFLEDVIQGFFAEEPAIPSPQIVERQIVEDQSTTPTQREPSRQADTQTQPRTESLFPIPEREPEPEIRRPTQPPPTRTQVTTPRRQETREPEEISPPRQPSPEISGERAIFFTSTAANSENLMEYQVRNSGDGDLHINAIRITGSDAGSYALRSPSSMVIPPGGSQTIMIAFQPSAPGAKRAMLQIVHNDESEDVYTIELIGSAISDNLTRSG